MLAAIQLENYYISRIEMQYTPDSEFIENKKINFSHSINYEDINKVNVTIDCSVSDKSGLLLSISLVGYFKIVLNAEEDDRDDLLNDEEIRQLCEENTLAILFPYVRSAISDISLKANVDPIILPTINILALVKKEREKRKQQLETTKE